VMSGLSPLPSRSFAPQGGTILFTPPVFSFLKNRGPKTEGKRNALEPAFFLPAFKTERKKIPFFSPLLAGEKNSHEVRTPLARTMRISTDLYRDLLGIEEKGPPLLSSLLLRFASGRLGYNTTAAFPFPLAKINLSLLPRQGNILGSAAFFPLPYYVAY